MAEYAAMKAVLTDRAFSEPGWVFERKLDGVRCGVIRNDGEVRSMSTGLSMCTPRMFSGVRFSKYFCM